MRVISICCARNEEDIIEAFVRHTLAYCDDLILLENGSDDATPEILRRLKDEGLAVYIITDATIGKVQVDQVNRLVRMAAHDFSADWIISLDADEFLTGPEAATFLPEPDSEDAVCQKIPMRSYYCTKEDPADVLNPVERITKRLIYEPALAAESKLCVYKTTIPGRLARLAGSYIAQGNHVFYMNGIEAPHRVAAGVWLAHFSLRSPGQYALKLATQHVQKFREISIRSNETPFYERPYRELLQSYTEFEKSFYDQAITYHPPHDRNALVSDPIQYAGGPLRYTAAQGSDVDILVTRLLNFAESLAASGANPGGAEMNGRDAPVLFIKVGTGGERSVEGSRRIEQALHFPLDSTSTSDDIRLHFQSDPGILEISELTLLYPGTERSFGAAELNAMLRVDAHAAMIHCEHTCRILISCLPVTVRLRGWKKEGEPAPEAMRIKLRYEDRLMPGIILDQSVLNTINRTHCDLQDQRLRAEDAAGRLGLLESSCYFPGSPIDFTSDGNAWLFIGEGWGIPEPWGIWTVGEKSTLKVRLPELPSSSLILEACIKAFAIPKSRNLEVRVYVDDEPLGRWSLTQSKFKPVRVKIPAGKIKSRDCKIRFDIENPVSPRDLDAKSTDDRKLGACFRSMVIRRPRFPWL